MVVFHIKGITLVFSVWGILLVDTYWVDVRCRVGNLLYGNRVEVRMTNEA
jgi:hypothetical protein